jgi:hypothetical protein
MLFHPAQAELLINNRKIASFFIHPPLVPSLPYTQEAGPASVCKGQNVRGLAGGKTASGQGAKLTWRNDK